MVNTKYNFKVLNKKSRSKRNLKDKSNKSKRKTSINRKINRKFKSKKKGGNQEEGKKQEEQITIQVRTTLDENEEISLKVHKNEKIYDSICEGLLSYKID